MQALTRFLKQMSTNFPLFEKPSSSSADFWVYDWAEVFPMKQRFVFLGLLLCLAAITASAQYGPFSPAYTGSGNPADLCTHYNQNTCIISEVCSSYYSGGYCTGPGPGGNNNDSGGMNNWLIQVTNNQGANYSVNTNGSGNSTGYIVTIGASGQRWYFTPNIGGTPYSCLFNPGTAAIYTTSLFGGATYYRSVQLCQ